MDGKYASLNIVPRKKFDPCKKYKVMSKRYKITKKDAKLVISHLFASKIYMRVVLTH